MLQKSKLIVFTSSHLNKKMQNVHSAHPSECCCLGVWMTLSDKNSIQVLATRSEGAETYDASFAARFTPRTLHFRTWKRSSDSGIVGTASPLAAAGLSGLHEIAIASFWGSSSFLIPPAEDSLKHEWNEKWRKDGDDSAVAATMQNYLITIRLCSSTSYL